MIIGKKEVRNQVERSEESRAATPREAKEAKKAVGRGGWVAELR
jgi:hypothetical protein